VLNVSQVNTTGIGGVSYVNQYTSAGFPVAGDRVRTVTADLVTAFNINSAILQPVNFGNNKVVAVFAGDARIVSANPVTGDVVVQLESGRLGLFFSPSAVAFDRTNPATWGVGAAGQLATFNLIGQDNVFQGNAQAEAITVLAAQTNMIAANAINPTLNQGTFLFVDLNDPFLPVTTFDKLPPGFPFTENLIAEFQERLLTTPLSLVPGGLAQLNAIAAFLGQPANIGGQAFATLGGNPAVATDFNPSGNLSTGDATFQAGGGLVPGIQPQQVPDIPEPATLLLWGVIATGGVAVGLRRRLSRKERMAA
jgi:hypothetical protein